MQQKVLYIGALLLICGLVKSDEVNHDNDNYYLNGLSIEQEQPIGSRREGDYYDAYPGQGLNLKLKDWSLKTCDISCWIQMNFKHDILIGYK